MKSGLSWRTFHFGFSYSVIAGRFKDQLSQLTEDLVSLNVSDAFARFTVIYLDRLHVGCLPPSPKDTDENVFGFVINP